MVISNHNSFRVMFDKIASVYFIWKIYQYFSIGNGQLREPALCQLYRRTFVPSCKWLSPRRSTALSSKCEQCCLISVNFWWATFSTPNAVWFNFAQKTASQLRACQFNTITIARKTQISQYRTVDRRHVQHSIMMNVTWQRFDQPAKQLIVGHTTSFCNTVWLILLAILWATKC